MIRHITVQCVASVLTRTIRRGSIMASWLEGMHMVNSARFVPAALSTSLIRTPVHVELAMAPATQWGGPKAGVLPSTK